MIHVPDDVELVLASASPRRRMLLEGAGLAVVVRPADVDETPLPGEEPAVYVARLALAKAVRGIGSVVSRGAGARDGHRATIVIAADTTVEVDGSILEKPVDRRDADRMLRLLSGRRHRCHTAVAVAAVPSRAPERPRTAVAAPQVSSCTVTTEVRFVELSDEAIEWYLQTGEADDKAGAYGIQGAAGAFVESVEGSVTNVIGLPLAQTLALVRDVLRSVAA